MRVATGGGVHWSVIPPVVAGTSGTLKTRDWKRQDWKTREWKTRDLESIGMESVTVFKSKSYGAEIKTIYGDDSADDND